MTAIQDYLLSPLSPLVFRSGTAFGSTDAALTVDFPLPSTLAGALRAAARSAEPDDLEVENQPVYGPLLIEMNAAGHGRGDLLLPTPADLVFACEQYRPFNLKAYPLVPHPPPTGAGWDEGLDPKLLHVDFVGGKDQLPADKPVVGPAYLRLSRYLEWLCGTAAYDSTTGTLKWQSPLGLSAIPRAVRDHVSIEPESQTADEGVLFRSQGLDLGPRFQEDPDIWCYYGLIMQTPLRLPAGCVRVGGRARLAQLEALSGLWPHCPRLLRDYLRRSRGLRLILATPAIFANGWLPGWLEQQDDGLWSGRPDPALDLTLTLRAVAVSGWQPVSMRDAMGTRSPVRRMAPAGSVYWFSIAGDPAAAANLWLQPLSDSERDKNDGFGLVLPGVWNPPATADKNNLLGKPYQ